MIVSILLSTFVVVGCCHRIIKMNDKDRRKCKKKNEFSMPSDGYKKIVKL